jgi:hypothetical protein
MMDTITYEQAQAELDADLERLADDILDKLLAEGMAWSEIPRAKVGIREKMAPLRRHAELQLAEVFAKVEELH